MRDKDLHNLIERDDPEKKAEFYERFVGTHDLTEKKPEKKLNFGRVVSYVATAACAVICLIIALPIVLAPLSDDVPPIGGIVDNDKGNTGGNSGEQGLPPEMGSGTRYFAAADCVPKDMGTIREYAVRHDVQLLSVEYSERSSVSTQMYLNKNDPTEIVFMHERITNSAETLDLYIAPKNNQVDLLTKIREKCTAICKINNVDVNWFDENGEHRAAFRYKNYDYYVDLILSDESGRVDPYILGVVMSMLFSDYNEQLF